MSVLRFILSGLWLPFRLYLQPYKFQREIAALAPDLPSDYGLWRARRHFRGVEFRHALFRLVLQSALAVYCWVMLCRVLWFFGLEALGYPLDLDWMKAFTVANTLAAVEAVSVVISAVMMSVVGGSVQSIVSFGVFYGVLYGMAPGVKAGVLGIMAFSMTFSMKQEVVGSVFFSVIIGVTLGVLYSVIENVTFGVSIGMALVLINVHSPTLILQLPAALLSWPFHRLWPQTSRQFWRIHPVRWDDIILLPLPGLPGLLATLYRLDSTEGKQALTETAAHKFQYRAAYQAWAMLAQEQARGIASLQGLAEFNNNLDWLKEDTPLTKTLRDLLLQLRDISQEIASALESDSATNQMRRIQEARAKLETLIKQQTGEFGPVIQKWTGLVEAGLAEARRRQREEEPIPQIYHGDGRPLLPDGRSDGDTPFKGRRALFRRLEEALGGAEGQRSTYLLVGQRRSGKTSALLQLQRRLGSKVVPAFLDLQSPALGGAADAAGLLHGVAGAVGDEARRRGVVLPDLTRNMLGADPYPAFGRWLDGVEKALAERRLLLCLDEYEALEAGLAAGRFDERLLMALRHIVQHRRRVDVLLSGSRPLDELPPRWASSLVNTLALPISFLEEKDARELIVSPIKGFPDIYRAATVERVLWWSHCQPYLVQLLCALLVERMNKARRMPPDSWVELDDVAAVVPLALQRGVGYFSDLWRGQAGGETAQWVLEALAEVEDLTLDWAALRKVEPDARALNTALRGLLRREIVAKDGEHYRILVPLVGEYVRAQRV